MRALSLAAALAMTVPSPASATRDPLGEDASSALRSRGLAGLVASAGTPTTGPQPVGETVARVLLDFIAQTEQVMPGAFTESFVSSSLGGLGFGTASAFTEASTVPMEPLFSVALGSEVVIHLNAPAGNDHASDSFAELGVPVFVRNLSNPMATGSVFLDFHIDLAGMLAGSTEGSAGFSIVAGHFDAAGNPLGPPLGFLQCQDLECFDSPNADLSEFSYLPLTSVDVDVGGMVAFHSFPMPVNSTTHVGVELVTFAQLMGAVVSATGAEAAVFFDRLHFGLSSIDPNILITPIPEPNAPLVALLALSLGAAAHARRRRTG